jgi:hypothetical protein
MCASVDPGLKDIPEPGRVTSLLAAGRSRHEGSHRVITDGL